MFTGYTGLTGKVCIKTEESQTANDAQVFYISNWSVETTTDIIEITELGVPTKKKLPGLQGWSASADGTVCFDGSNSHIRLFDAKKAGDPVKVMLYLDNASKSTKEVYFEGEGYIESLSVDLSAEDKGNISISIAGDGELELVS